METQFCSTSQTVDSILTTALCAAASDCQTRQQFGKQPQVTGDTSFKKQRSNIVLHTVFLLNLLIIMQLLVGWPGGLLWRRCRRGWSGGSFRCSASVGVRSSLRTPPPSKRFGLFSAAGFIMHNTAGVGISQQNGNAITSFNNLIILLM